MDHKTTTSTPSDEILYEVRDSVAFVTFNRPQARNAFTFGMYERLAEICASVNEDHAVRAMVLTGAGGKAFAAGTDISQFRAFDKPEDALGYESRIDRVLGALETCRVPTIAAIVGACTGGGAGIAGCCDLRIAAGNARFGLPIARTLGNCLSMSNYSRFAALIGPARLKEMIFTARLIEAPEALQIGLVSEVIAEPADLMVRAEELARTVAGHAPLTLQACKEALRRLRPTISKAEGEDLILMCYMSEDFREGIDAFLNKRPPQFKGK
jgi:enoyl-CoA hydratase/carnithine racemase